MLKKRSDERSAAAAIGSDEGFDAALAATPLLTVVLFAGGGLGLSLALRASGLRADVERLTESALMCGALGASWFAIVRNEGYRLSDALGPLPDRVAVRIALGVTVTGAFVSQFMLRLSYRFSLPLGVSDRVDAAGGGVLSALDVCYWIALPILVGPLVEELVFRGLLFRKWRRTLGPFTGWLLSSAVFGALHFENALPAAVLGALYALAYTSTRTLWTAILAHVLFNTLGVLPNLIARVAGFRVGGSMQTGSALLVLLGGSSAAGLLWIGRRALASLANPLPPFHGPLETQTTKPS